MPVASNPSCRRVGLLAVPTRPVHPFPAAAIDGLSVANYFLELSPVRKVHVGGVSAGGYLGVITVLE